jgi:hypothetical protein
MKLSHVYILHVHGRSNIVLSFGNELALRGIFTYRTIREKTLHSVTNKTPGTGLKRKLISLLGLIMY